MTAPHPSPLSTTSPRSTTASTAAGIPRILPGLAGALLAAVVLTVPASALAAEPAVRTVVASQQKPQVAEQPQPGATFGDPVPPVPNPTATSGTDPATGFPINARTGFLVHPPTGYLIEPGTGFLLFADTLIYTNLRYDAATGVVSVVPGETPVPPPSAEPTAPPQPSPTAATDPPVPATPSSPPAMLATPSSPPPVPATPTSAPATPSVSPSAPPSATPSTPSPARTATPTAADTPAAVGEERAASLASVAWIGAGLVALALAVVAVLAVRRRGRHQS